MLLSQLEALFSGRPQRDQKTIWLRYGALNLEAAVMDAELEMTVKASADKHNIKRI